MAGNRITIAIAACPVFVMTLLSLCQGRRAVPISALKTLKILQLREAIAIIIPEPVFLTPGVLKTLLLQCSPPSVCPLCFSFPSLLRLLPVVLFPNPGSFHSRGQSTGKGAIHQLCPDGGWVQMGSNHQRDHVVHFGESRPPGGRGASRGRSSALPNQGKGAGSQQPGREKCSCFST